LQKHPTKERTMTRLGLWDAVNTRWTMQYVHNNCQTQPREFIWLCKSHKSISSPNFI